MNHNKAFGLAILFLILMIGYSCLYIVREGQQGLLLRFGKLVIDSKTGKPSIQGPGLHFKLPIIYQTRIFDTRLQTLDIKSSRIVTVDQKSVLVDYYVKWRISDLPLYFVRTGGFSRQAQILLEPQLNDGLRAEFGRRTINEVVSDARTNIMETLQAQANKTVQGLGIKVIDVRIKRIDLPEEVSNAIYDQMRAAREKVAAEHRAQGKAMAETIRAKADATASVIVATAKADAATIRGDGDAEAAKLFADTYSKDPDFFAFYRSLLAYKTVFNSKQDILVLKPDTKFFKYFKSPGKEQGQP